MPRPNRGNERVGNLVRIRKMVFIFLVVFLSKDVSAAADTYPMNSVRVIVPTQAGGSVDLVGRLLASELTKRLGKTFVVDDRGGAGGIIGVDLAAKSIADGYTLLVVSATQTITPSLQTLPYDPVKSFTPIAKIAAGRMALVVHPSLPVKSVKDFISLAKRKPGALIFGGTGKGSIVHMATVLFNQMAGIDCLVVQFKSAGPAVIDLLGGHSQAMMGTIASVLPHIKTEKLRALATSGERRSVILPSVPTVAEAGVLHYETSIWFGLMAPAGVPSDIIEKINLQLRQILNSEEVKNTFLNNAVEVDYLEGGAFGQFMIKEIDQWAKIVKKTNLTANP